MCFYQTSRQHCWRLTTFGAILGIALVVATSSHSYAQISFGKMRAASEKAKDAPKLENEGADETFDVDPNEKTETQEAAPTKSSGRVTFRNNSRNGANGATRASNTRETRATAEQKKASSTNGIANAMSEPLDDESKATTSEASAKRTTGAAKTRSSSNASKKDATSESKSGADGGNADRYLVKQFRINTARV